MRIIPAIIITLALSSSAALAQTCKAEATQKKLAGAALKSFMTKCEADAGKTCDTNAADKKLAGAAKRSFVNKCVNDAVGTLTSG